MTQRYHKLLVTEDLLRVNAKNLSLLFQDLWLKYTQNQLKETEFCAIYLLSFQMIRSPEQVFVGFSHAVLVKEELPNSISLGQAIAWILKFLNGPTDFDLQNLKTKNWPLEKSLFQVLNQGMLKGIPRSGLHALLYWHLQKYPLFLLSHVPTAQELLQFQSEGRRCVSVFLQESELARLHSIGRDPLSFLLHDFFHAEHFMEDPLQFKAQIGFSKLMKRFIVKKEIQFLLTTDSIFCKELEYLYSDMNAQVSYLFVTLRAITWKAFDRAQGQFGTQQFSEFWRAILQDWHLPETLDSINELHEEIFTKVLSEKFCQFLSFQDH